MKRPTRYSSSSERKSYFCSIAGQLGSSSRWSNHKKKKTKLIRIYEDDYNSISRLLPLDDSINSFASFFNSASSLYLRSRRFSCNSSS